MNKKSILFVSAMALLSGAIIAGNVVAGAYAPMITTFLCGTGVNFDSKEFAEATAKSDELCQEIAEEGIVLMKNQNNALPLKYEKDEDKNINVFGWASSDNGFLLSGVGSGSSTIQEKKKVTLLKALEDEGFMVNEDLVNFYKDYDSTKYKYDKDRIKLIEPNLSDYDAYDKGMLKAAENYSDTALVVISRLNGENVGEIPLTQTKTKGQGNDSSRSYLQLSTQEEELLEYCGDHYEKVIVIINSTNQMELGFLDDPRIDAVLNVQILGQSGARAIPKILEGTVNPSGRLIDTYAYDYTKEPSFVNRFKNGKHIAYKEDIYFGYRWYETADKEGFFKNESRKKYDANDNEITVTGYDAVVQFPFGHGLSYTTFEWTVDSFKIIDGEEIKDVNSTNNIITKKSKIELNLSCTNTGSVAGKDVIQLYYSAPYYEGEIEKSAINLGDYAKTTLLKPGDRQTNIRLSLDAYDMASYDCYDLNGNDFMGYELEKGSYELKLMEDSHHEKALKDNANATLELKVNEEIHFDKDPTTNHPVENRFTGENAYANTPIDGSTVYNNASDNITYLTRADFVGTFPKTNLKTPTNSSKVTAANNYTNTSFDQTEMPVTSKAGNLYLKTKEDGSKASFDDLIGNGAKTIYNEELIYKIGQDYNAKELTDMVDQMSAAELFSIVEDSGFGTPAIASIGKPKSYDYDGPAGFNAITQGVTSGEWTAFPSETLIGQTFSKQIARMLGQAVGVEGQTTNLQGWYAPGVNMHRSPYNGRNYEYYSEDPVLNGYMAANVIEGAKSKGLYCYLKHFTLSEPGDNARDLNTWLTEQNFREIYLKPFEIAVKKGGANAMMSAFNFVGGVWAGANKAMNIDVLRDEWGFKGSMITDWSDGSGSMNTRRGNRAGNDIWLNPNSGRNAVHLSSSNATDVYCAKMAAKNVIYTFCETYNYFRHYDASKDNMVVTVGQSQVKPPFAWWIPVLIAFDVLSFAGLGLWAFFGVIKPLKKENNR